ncbi:MAG: aldo/keto reductase, partial [Planctomycetota bacterium]|jgi:aryl-alcohol dehydrogenase-like predicted oxidoreductase
VLSGKYQRGEAVAPARGASVSDRLTDATFDLLDVIRALADEIETGVAEVALAWVRQRGALPIVGARTSGQLAANLASAAVVLSGEQLARLDATSEPAPCFPQSFLERVATVRYNGCTIDGRSAPEWPLSPVSPDEQW